jgi:PAS domain S-box-containing protein
MLLSFGLLFVLAITTLQLVELYGVPFTGIEGEIEQTRREVFENLNLVADLKKERLLRWLDERRGDAELVSMDPGVNSNMFQVLDAVHKSVASGNIGIELWANVRQSQAYNDLVHHLKLVKLSHAVYDSIHVVDTVSGAIIASTVDAELGMSHSELTGLSDPVDVGQTVEFESSEHARDGGLDLSLTAKMGASDGSGDDESGAAALLVMRVAINDMLEPMLHTGGGLGATGEVLLVNRDVKILTSLAHPLSDGSTARPLQYQITAEPARRAARGEEGIIAAEDYRNEPVLAAYRYIPISTDTGWGMVVKRDEAEIFGPSRERSDFVFYLGFGGILLVLGAAYLIAGSLSRPIRLLQATAHQVEGGDLGARMPASSSGEMGTLVNTFNAMAERIQGWNDELTSQVQLRTEELRVSEQWFRSIFEVSPIGIVLSDNEFRIIEVNPAFREMLAYREDELLGRTIADITHPEDIAANEEIRARLRGSDDLTYAQEKRYITKDGRAIWVRVAGSVVRDEHGSPLYWLGIAEDISETKLEEQRLQEAHDELERRVEERTDELRARTADLEALHGIANLASQPGTFSERMERVLEDLARISDTDQLVLRMIDEEAQELQVVATEGLERNDLEPIHLAETGDPGGRLLTLAVQSRQVVVENHYHEFPHALPYLTQMGVKSVIVLPILSEGRLLGTFSLSSTKANHFSPDLVRLLTSVATGMGSFLDSANLMGRVQDANQRLEDTLGELRRTQERIIQQERLSAIGTLASGVAHDFNNLLSIILGFSELAEAAVPEDSPARDSLAEVANAGKRAAELTRQLLAFSSRQVSEARTGDLRQVLIDTDRMLRRLIGEDIELKCNATDEPAIVGVDFSQLESILVNLAVNARDAMPGGGKLTIDLAFVTLDDDAAGQFAGLLPGQYVRLAVTDTGQGMDPETASHVFEPFFTTKDRDQGTGLGLSTCYGIVNQHGRDIRVESRPGGGTTFTVLLPIAEELPAPASQGSEDNEALRGTETVLVAEDEPSVRRLAVVALRRQGYTVLEASNGEEALGMVLNYDEGDLHLLLTDLIMPQMGGMKLIDRIRNLRPQTKILITSGYTDDPEASTLVSEAHTSFLPKPFTPQLLVRKVRDTLDRPP